MGNEELQKLISKVPKFTEEQKNKPIDEFVDDFGSVYIGYFKELGIETLTDLLNSDTQKLYEYIKSKRTHRSFFGLRETMMYMGLLFDKDKKKFESEGISEDIALIPISRLKIPPSIEERLNKSRRFCLGDLLTEDYEGLRNLIFNYSTGFNALNNLLGLRKCIHSLGFKLKNEHSEIEIIKKAFKIEGISTIDEILGTDVETCNFLYENDIYTLDQLLNCGQDIYKLTDISKIQIIIDAMKSKGIYFESIVPSRDTISNINDDNEAIKSRIDSKEKLLLEYIRLINEQELLRKRERELNESINENLMAFESITKK